MGIGAIPHTQKLATKQGTTIAMKTITIASAKGGSGKSTLAAALAVRAGQDGRAAMMDLNFDQGSLTQWWTIRGRPEAPHFAQNFETIPQGVQALAAAFDWLIIDTPPLLADVIEQSIMLADAVIVPVKPGLFDALAARTVSGLCKKHRRRFSFVLTAVDGRHKVLAQQASLALAELGTVMAPATSYRRQWVTALNVGKTGPELDKELRPEIDAIWTEVKALATKGRV